VENGNCIEVHSRGRSVNYYVHISTGRKVVV
jgi:hypothetical protein